MASWKVQDAPRSILPAAPLYALPSVIAVLAASVAAALLASANSPTTGELAILLTAIGLALGTVFLTVESGHRHRDVYRAAGQDAARLYADVTVLLGRFDRPGEAPPAPDELRDALTALREAHEVLSALPEAPLRRELEQATSELEGRIHPTRATVHRQGPLDSPSGA